MEDDDCEDPAGRALQQEALELTVELDLEERRRKVLSLRLQGLSMRDIAEKVGVSPQTVSKDLAAMHAHNIKQVTQATTQEHLGDVMTHFMALEKMALSIFFKDTAKDTDKLKAVDLVRVIQSDKLKALKETGFLTPQAPSGKDNPTNTAALQELISGDPQLMAKISYELILAKLTPELPAPVPESEILDAEFTEDEPPEEE